MADTNADQSSWQEDPALLRRRAPAPPPPLRPRQISGSRGMRGAVIVGWLVALLALMGVVLGPLWVWFWWRIEPPTGQVAVLIRKTGKDLSQDRLLALEPGEKGVQLEVLPEGRHWRNPYTWDWLLVPIIDIPAGRLGVQVRLYGQDPPPGQIIATEGQRGILGEVLGPGKYRVNPYAYEIRILDAVSIKPGCVGVVTSLVGQDILTGPEQTPAVNEFLVGPGSKGVVPEVKDPGTYYLNPYVFNVVEVNLQSQRFEMSGEDAITFLAQDGFTVRAEGTIEFCLMRDKAAKLTHQVGDIDDILQKIILPRTRGFSRIEGSKKPAVDFIAGETRQAFQDNLQKHLTETCEPWGIAVNSVLIRNIIPPEGIAQLIRDREIAVQEARKFEQQITQAKSKAELVRQETLAEQNRKKVEADTTKLKAVIEAKQRVAVNIIGGERDLEVAKIEALAAKAKAGAQTVEAEAKRDVVRLANDAEAAVLAQKAKAFSGGEAYARYLLMTTLAPRLQSVLASDQAGGVADILAPPAVLPGKEVPR